MKIPKSIRASLAAVLEYLWDDERAHYEDNPEPNHIFLHAQAIADRLDRLDDDDDGGGEPLPPIVADCPKEVAA
jgi:hypothetical protein